MDAGLHHSVHDDRVQPAVPPLGDLHLLEDLIELPPARELDYARGEPSEIGAREGFRWHRRGLREAARGRIGGGGGGGERGAGRKEGSRWGIRGPRSDLKEGRRRSAKGKADAVHRCGAKALLLPVG